MSSRPLLIALVAGMASATGFAPLNFWPALMVGLAVLLWLTHEAPTLKAVLLRGWIFGVGHFTVGNNWIQHAFDFQDKMPPVLGYFAVVLLSLYLALYPAMAMGLAWRFSRRVTTRAGWQGADAGFVLVAAAAWIATEWLRGVMFTGYPWNPLGVVWLPLHAIAQAGALVGTYALSGVMVMAAGVLYLAFVRDYRAAGALAIAIGALGIAARLIVPAVPAADATRLVRVVQPNIGQEAVGAPDYNARLLSRLVWGSGRAGAQPRLIVWPEGMVNDWVEDGYPRNWYRIDPRAVRAQIASGLGPNDRVLIGGTALFVDQQGNATGVGNGIWSVDPDGMLGPRYDKAHLVPYGEYLPMRTLLAPLGLARLVMGDVDYVPGPGPRTLPVQGFGNIGMQICYEIIFSGQVVDPANRPDMLFNPSNDAWFGTWGPPQHLAQARMRAIEEGLPILRATPTGISAIIDAHGGLVDFVPPGQEGAAEAPMPRPLPPTPFSRLGNWMAAIVAALFLMIAIAIRRARR